MVTARTNTDPDPGTPNRSPPPRDTRPTVSTNQIRPNRYVFIEESNSDGWIATDLALDLTDHR